VDFREKLALFEALQEIEQRLAFPLGKVSVAGHLDFGIELAGLDQHHLQLLPGEAGADAVQPGGQAAWALPMVGKANQTPGQIQSGVRDYPLPEGVAMDVGHPGANNRSSIKIKLQLILDYAAQFDGFMANYVI